MTCRKATAPDLPRHEGLALFTPAYLGQGDELGLKVVSLYPENARRGLPVIHALVALFDAATGQPGAVLPE